MLTLPDIERIADPYSQASHYIKEAMEQVEDEEDEDDPDGMVP